MSHLELLQEISKIAGYSLTVKLLTPTAQAPVKAHAGDAGFDICADEDVTIEPGQRATVSTGVAVDLPSSLCYARVAPRSGLSSKYGLDVMAGVVDSIYQGEVKVCLINHGSDTYFIGKGDRIAQLVLTMIMPTTDTVVVDSFESESDRGENGFGSTGK